MRELFTYSCMCVRAACQHNVSNVMFHFVCSKTFYTQKVYRIRQHRDLQCQKKTLILTAKVIKHISEFHEKTYETRKKHVCFDDTQLQRQFGQGNGNRHLLSSDRISTKLKME